MRSPIYLDHNATTPVHPAVVAAMAPFWEETFYNPSSSYPAAEGARAAVAEARTALAALLHASPDAITWTSGGTESDNWAITAGFRHFRGTRPRILISAVEHPAVRECAHALMADGAQVEEIPVDADGRLKEDALAALLREDVAIVAVMLANNEVGTIQPVAEAARLAHAVGALVLTDAAQAVGKIPVDVNALDVDFLAVAGHKLYAPKGVGALYVRPGLDLPPLLHGGGQEGGRRSGTENAPGIVGLGKAAELARLWLRSDGPSRQAELRDLLAHQLAERVPGFVEFAAKAARLPNTLACAFPGIPGRDLLARIPELAAGTGSACHREGEGGSPTLQAMGVPPEAARGLIRLSLGRSTTEEEILRAGELLVAASRAPSSL